MPVENQLSEALKRDVDGWSFDPLALGDQSNIGGMSNYALGSLPMLPPAPIHTDELHAPGM